MRIHAEANLSALIESTEDLIWSVDPRYRLITFNRAFQQHYERNFGGPVAPGMTTQELLPPVRAVFWPPLYERALAGEKFRIESIFVDERTLELAFNPIVVDGKITGVSVFGKDITERKAAEKKYQDIFDGALEGFYQITPEGKFLTVNRALAMMLGYDSPQEVIASVADFAREVCVDADERARLSRQLEEQGYIRDYECQFKRKNGSFIWVLQNSRCVRNAEGELLCYEGSIQDITERKRAEVALISSENTFRAITETSPLAIILSSGADERVEYVNPTFTRLFGYTKEDIATAAAWWPLAYPDAEYRQCVMEDWKRSVEHTISTGSNVNRAENVVTTKDGSKKIVEWGLVNAGDRNLVFGVDITERKRAEMLLRDSEERYRSTFEQAAVGIVHVSFEGRILRCNERFARIVGYPQEELSGFTVRQLTAPEDAAESAAVIRRIMNGGDAETMEKRYIRKDGSLSWAKTTVSIQRNIQGEPLHLIAFIEDISERKRAEMLLRESEERYRTAFQTSIDAITISHLEDGKFVDVNQAFLLMFGYECEEVVGRTSLELMIWQNPRDRQELVKALSANSFCRDMEFQLNRKNGQSFWVLVSGALTELDGVPSLLLVARDLSDVKAVERRLTEAQYDLRVSEERHRLAFQTSPNAVSIARLDNGLLLDVNETFLDMMGFKSDEVTGRTIRELKLWADRREQKNMVETLRSDHVFRGDVQLMKKSGEIIWGRMSASVFEHEGVSSVLTVTQDISEAKAAEQRLATTIDALRRSEQRYRTAFQTSLDAISICHIKDGRFVDVNEAYLQLYGYEREELIGRTSPEMKMWVDHRDRQTMVEFVRQNASFRSSEVQFRKKNGEIVWGEMSASEIEIDGIPCILAVTRDISSAKAAENTIRDLAFYDPLTGLPNRRLLLERLRQTLIASAQSNRSQALLYVELDNFKTLNETLGHQTGDHLIQEVARRIVACVQETDAVSRLAGDEFAVMLEDLSEVAEEAAAQAEAVGEKILALISMPYLLDGRECLTTASIGITVFKDQREGAEELMQRADVALYQAKAAGRNTIHFFSPALQAAVNARATLEEDLRHAIKEKQFLLYYQPQVSRGRLTGAEALIRWQHPTNGMVPPDEFIPLAEETGLILPLGEWVLETSCAQIAAWATRKKTNHIALAVNISALQFRQANFVASVLAALDHSGANPANLKLELTESMLVENIDEVIAKMTELKSHGLSFSLDDFGTGYSSLAYLKRLPLDQLKIDRAFVRDMLVDVTSGAIAQTIISLGRAMGLSVIAEGVETEEQRGFLAGLGCHTFQGTLFSSPLSLEDFEAFL
jgi:diguanylate cyclase (GGDEF)-like protein/PAS domain S-box-containing protein